MSLNPTLTSSVTGMHMIFVGILAHAKAMVSSSLWSCQLSRSTFSENPNGRFRRRQAMDDMPLKIRQTHTQVCSLNKDVPSKIQLLMECHSVPAKHPRSLCKVAVLPPKLSNDLNLELHSLSKKWSKTRTSFTPQSCQLTSTSQRPLASH